MSERLHEKLNKCTRNKEQLQERMAEIKADQKRLNEQYSMLKNSLV